VRKYETSTPTSSPPYQGGDLEGVSISPPALIGGDARLDSRRARQEEGVFRILVPLRNFAGNCQSGQTLIETVVAIFILASGLSAGLALAVFAFSSTSNNAERVVATSLAREGVEVVRRMRDSNWLRDNIAAADGNDCNTLPAGEPCYEDWLDQFYNINGSTGAGANRRAVFNPASPNQGKWAVDSSSSYRLYLQSGGGINHSSSGGATQTNYFRKLTIVNQNTGTADNESRILVRSTVWWWGRRCNNTLTNLTNPNQTRCKIIVEEYLTNWKNYEL